MKNRNQPMNPRLWSLLLAAPLILAVSCDGDKVGGYRPAVLLQKLGDDRFVEEFADGFRDYGQVARLGEGAYLALGRHFRDAGRVDEAIRVFETGWDKETGRFREMVAEDLIPLHIDQGSWALAERSALRAHRVYPDNPDFTRWLVLSRQAQFKDTRVLRDLNDLGSGVVAGDPELLLAQAVSRSRTGSPGVLDPLVTLFFDYRALPVHGTAASWLESLEEADWDTSRIPRDLVYGRAALAAGRFDEAAARFAALPDDLLLRDSILRDFGRASSQTDDSQVFFDRLQGVPGFEENAAGLTWMGILRRQSGLYGDAARHFRQAWVAGARDDVVLWYWWDSLSKVDMISTRDVVVEYARYMTDPLNFADVFDHLSAAFAGAGDFGSIESMYRAVQTWMDPGTRGRWALTLAFAAGEGYAGSPADRASYLEVAYQQDDDWYAQLVAAVALGEPVRFLEPAAPAANDSHRDDALALALARFSRLDDLYLLARGADSDLSPVALNAIADRYVEEGDFLRALRILTVHLRKGVTGDGLIEAAYPRAFDELISGAASERDLPPALLFGLIREESFFSPEVSSHAGAVGLSQLMPATAADVASRMGLRTYDVTNPQDNVAIGSWYLADLRRRLGPLQALFAYNAGWGRVKRWNTLYSHYPSPLYLEAVGIEETRTYGRKVITATVIYANLYEGTDPRVTLAEFFPELAPIEGAE